jgi:hypothetical protein
VRSLKFNLVRSLFSLVSSLFNLVSSLFSLSLSLFSLSLSLFSLNLKFSLCKLTQLCLEIAARRPSALSGNGSAPLRTTVFRMNMSLHSELCSSS